MSWWSGELFTFDTILIYSICKHLSNDRVNGIREGELNAEHWMKGN